MPRLSPQEPRQRGRLNFIFLYFLKQPEPKMTSFWAGFCKIHANFMFLLVYYDFKM